MGARDRRETDLATEFLEEIEAFFRDRLTNPVSLTTGIDNTNRGTRLRMLVIPPDNDLGVVMTHGLARVFETFPIESVSRCMFEPCGNFFVPGAQGRRVPGISAKYCGEHHKEAQKRRRKRSH